MCPTFGVQFNNLQTTFPYTHTLTCFDYNENGQLIAQHQWKVPSKEENARNGLPETDWRDAQYDMLYLPVTETVLYHYDFNGNRTATVLPDGRQINYLYYGSGHLHQISLDDEVVTDIERDQLHREIYRTQGKLASRYELDPLGRLKKQIATLNDLTETGKGKTKVAVGYGQTAVKRSYGYDRTGNLTHSTDQRTGTTQFEYDKLGRITKAGSERFAFDPAHNILSDGLNAVPDNRLKTYNGTTYYYDDLGNLIHRELADGEVQNYFYDLHDQLVKAEIFKKDGTKETWAYSYDALGRRIGKGRLKDGEVSETSFPHDLGGNDLENPTRFVWDGSHLLQEQNSDGRYTYIYADQDSYEPLAQIRDWTTEDGESCQQIQYFHCDQIGIPREMTDKDGNLLWFGNYTGWGRLKEETKVTDSAYQPFRLQNQYADRETGLHYNFFRYYEPNVGRFVSQDPIGLMGGENLYWFAPNAQDWVDPLGESGYKLRLSMESQNMFRPNSSWQTHHLIPQAVWKENKAFFNAIGMKGKGLGRDSWTNGLYMPSTEADARSSLREFFHRGSHNNYNDSVSRELKKIRKEFKQGKITAEQARQRVQDLQERLKKRLSKSISVGGCGSANSPKRLA